MPPNNRSMPANRSAGAAGSTVWEPRPLAGIGASASRLVVRLASGEGVASSEKVWEIVNLRKATGITVPARPFTRAGAMEENGVLDQAIIAGGLQIELTGSLGFQLAHQREHLAAEVLDFLDKVQEARQH